MRPFLLAVSFLTRLPVRISGDLREADLASTAAWFPLVGALVGGLVGVVEWSGTVVAGPLVGPALAVLATALVTGGLHLDGAADTVDGLASGPDRARALAVMRDSRVGAFGALTVGLDVLMRFALLVSVAPSRRWPALIGSAVAGRSAVVWAVARFPYARAVPGLGSPFARRVRPARLLMAGCLAAATTGVLAVGAGWRAPLGLGLALLAGALAAFALNDRLGGLTGDTYGFVNEVAEIAALLAWASRWSP